MSHDEAIFAGGCFWCTEAVFGQLSGVSSVQSGYIGGNTVDPTYKEVCGGNTGHAEAIRIAFDAEVISYADLAAKAGRPLAVRAAGTAMATNLIAPIVPCHRVIKTGGAVGNYGFGIDLKLKLLAHEGVDL